ncbi:MAG: hypothetical protein EXS01_04180 [Phycisphaerales bacterium]|nr:hypothetical protein [Phycisphaerales bacterium]
MHRIPPFLIAVACVVLLGLLPTRWIAPLTTDLSSVLWVPLTPLAHLGTEIRLWLRPRSELPTEADRAVREDRDFYRGLWHSEQIRVQDLEKKLRVYEVVVGAAPPSDAVRLAAANVVARTPGSGGLALKLNVGAQHGITAGDVAVVEGDCVVGRIAPEVRAVASTVISIANRSTGRIDCYVTPADQERAKRPQVIPIQILPDGGGLLRGDIDWGTTVATGDTVRIRDPSWPIGAQGMRLGVVLEIRRKDAQPLRGEVTVRLAVDPAVVGELVVKLQPSANP